MPAHKKKQLAKTHSTKQPSFMAFLRTVWNACWHRGIWRRIFLILSAIVITAVVIMFSVGQWYIAKHRNDPLKLGMTFIPSYAKYFGVDPHETFLALRDDLGFRRFRLVSYWNVGEPTKGTYNFDELDWEFKQVEQVGGKVTLAIGLRQPRWPECHMPEWARALPKDQWAPQLKDYIGQVINRYKNSPALESYQLENEYFLKVFGECPDFSRERLIDEFNYVKSQDSTHPVIITRSNNAVPSWPVGQPRADENGASIYKRVWDRTVTKRYFEYPLPGWFYAFLAGGEELTTGKNTIIHELQTEAWPPDGIKNASIEEQNKSFDASRMHSRIQYGLDTGMRTIDMWGGEWWYWRKVKMNDPSIWDAAKTELQKLNVSQSY